MKQQKRFVGSPGKPLLLLIRTPMEAATAKKTGVNVRVRKILADTVTPVTLYLGLRDHYTFPVLLESNDFRSKEDCHSFIGLDSIASFKVQNGWIHRQFPDKSAERTKVDGVDAVPDAFYNFLQAIQPAESPDAPEFNGVFGHTGFDAVQYFDTLQFDPDKRRFDLPDIHYHFYRFVISFNHFKDELTILENIPDGEMSKMEELETRLIGSQVVTHLEPLDDPRSYDEHLFFE